MRTISVTAFVAFLLALPVIWCLGYSPYDPQTYYIIALFVGLGEAVAAKLCRRDGNGVSPSADVGGAAGGAATGTASVAGEDRP